MSRHDDALIHLERARETEKRKDYLGARIDYLSCVESLKQAGADTELQEATKEYEDFVKRDPVFERLISKLLPIIQANPGILQSEITKQFESMEWPELYYFDRPVAKEDIYYALYFADKFGIISRTKKGRSYELRMPVMIEDIKDTPKLETVEPDTTQAVNYVMVERKPAKGRKSTGLAGFLNLIIPGAGYLYCGLILRSFIAFFVCTFLAIGFIGSKMPILFFIMCVGLAIDAVRCADKLNRAIMETGDQVKREYTTPADSSKAGISGFKTLGIVAGLFFFAVFISIMSSGYKNYKSINERVVQNNIESKNSVENKPKDEIPMVAKTECETSALPEAIKTTEKKTESVASKPDIPQKDTKADDTKAMETMEKRFSEYQEKLKKYYPDYLMMANIQRDALILSGLDGAYSKSSEPDQKKLYSRIKVLRPKVEALQRVVYAQDVEKRSKDNGINAEINAKGDKKQIFEYKFVLMTSALAHQVANGGDVMAKAKGIGFTKMIFTDGYNGSWSYDLK